jgi:hypothetical protein
MLQHAMKMKVGMDSNSDFLQARTEGFDKESGKTAETVLGMQSGMQFRRQVQTT